jgi:hypothetical protein
MKLSVLTRQYVELPVVYKVAGVEADPTGFPVRSAFVAEGAEPEEDDFVAGTWGTSDDGYVALALVGPDGDHELTVGSYDGWVEVTATPEKVVALVDKLRIV